MPGTAKLHTIQLLRFMAALSVVVAHAVSAAAASFGDPTPLRADFLGAVGVSMFFIVSGFIMIHSTRGRFGQPGAVATFLQKRTIRIVPIYWVATLVALAGVVFGSGRATGCSLTDPAYLVASFMFIAYPRCDGELQPLLTQGWTLNYEAFFYLAFGLSLLVRRRLGCLLLGGAFAALVLAGMVLRGSGMASSGVAAFYTDPIVLLFIGGILAGLIREQVGTRVHVPGGPVGLAAGTIVAFLAIDMAIPYSSEAGRSHALVWVVAPIVALVFAFAATPARQGRLALTLERLGDASYSIYLTHIFALTAVRKLWTSLGLAADPFGFVIVGTGSALLVGYAVYRGVERPLTAALRGRTHSPALPVEFQA